MWHTCNCWTTSSVQNRPFGDLLACSPFVSFFQFTDFLLFLFLEWRMPDVQFALNSPLKIYKKHALFAICLHSLLIWIVKLSACASIQHTTQISNYICLSMILALVFPLSPLSHLGKAFLCTPYPHPSFSPN